jgi:hypothetical protein
MERWQSDAKQNPICCVRAMPPQNEDALSDSGIFNQTRNTQEELVPGNPHPLHPTSDKNLNTVMLLLLVLLAVVLSSVNAHAILKVPTSWCVMQFCILNFSVIFEFFLLFGLLLCCRAVAPSKSSPCGNGVPTGVVAQYTAGSNVTLTWQVIAGDGTGTIQSYVPFNFAFH